MSYYPTIEEDLQRAKEILAKGDARREIVRDFPNLNDTDLQNLTRLAGGMINGADTYAAYKLLESFVAIIEGITPGVCRLILQAIDEGKRQATEHT